MFVFRGKDSEKENRHDSRHPHARHRRADGLRQQSGVERFERIEFWCSEVLGSGTGRQGCHDQDAQRRPGRLHPDPDGGADGAHRYERRRRARQVQARARQGWRQEDRQGHPDASACRPHRRHGRAAQGLPGRRGLRQRHAVDVEALHWLHEAAQVEEHQAHGTQGWRCARLRRRRLVQGVLPDEGTRREGHAEGLQARPEQ